MKGKNVLFQHYIFTKFSCITSNFLVLTYTKKKKCEIFCEDVVKLSTVDDQVDDNEAKIYGHEEIEVRTSFAIFLQKMIPQFEAEVSLHSF